MKIPALNPSFNRKSQKGFIKTLERKDGHVIIKKYNKETKKLTSELVIFRNGNKQYKEIKNRIVEKKVDFYKGQRLYQVRNPQSNSQTNRFILTQKLEKFGYEFLDMDWISFFFDEKGRQTAFKIIKKYF